jgi:hypothetical protein
MVEDRGWRDEEVFVLCLANVRQGGLRVHHQQSLAHSSKRILITWISRYTSRPNSVVLSFEGLFDRQLHEFLDLIAY